MKGGKKTNNIPLSQISYNDSGGAPFAAERLVRIIPDKRAPRERKSHYFPF